MFKEGVGTVKKFKTLEEMQEYIRNLPDNVSWRGKSSLPNKGDYSVEVK